jgi:C_GCAxxG_C_C family probable redox protein
MVPQEAKAGHQAKIDEKVQAYLGVSGNCAQTSFITLQEVFDLGGEDIVKALTAFPGIALRGETCGAVVGSLMAMGLVYGRDRKQLNDYKRYLASLPSARKFCRAFEEAYGSTMCGDVVEKQFGKRYNLADQTEAMEWASQDATGKCGEVISTAVQIASELIQRKKKDS